ncbi:hypothetical protein Tco_0221914 [Tanacetum coccineum]
MKANPRVPPYFRKTILYGLARALIDDQGEENDSPDESFVEFADELAHIIFPPGNGDLPFNAESDLLELEYLLNHDPIKDMDSILEGFPVLMKNSLFMHKS